jgi:hypothetical protein
MRRPHRRRPAIVPHFVLVLIVTLLSGIFAGTAPAAASATAKQSVTKKAAKKAAKKKSTKKSTKAKKKAKAKAKTKAKSRATSTASRCKISRLCPAPPTTVKPTKPVSSSTPAPSAPAPTPAPATGSAPASSPASTATDDSATNGTVAAFGFNGFGATAHPSASWRPYSASSPFNQTATSAAVAPRSAQVVARTLGWGAPANLVAGAADTPDDYAHPVYYSQPTDPIVTLHATEPWGRAAIEGMQIRVPAAARPAGGTDGHLTVITPDGWEYDLWESQTPRNGTLNFGWGGRIRVDGNGLGADGTAAQFGNLAGIIRPEELAAGKINHALFIVVKCTSSDTTFGLGVKPHRAGDLGSSYIYPAGKGGSSCPSNQTDAPPMGARFRLNMTDAQIAALPVPKWKKTVLTAFAHYGGYVGDTGGPGFGFQFESGTSYTSFGQKDPFVSYAQSNNLPTWQGRYVYGMPGDVDWSRYLQVVAPPEAS